jgi:hypothetical protein
MRHRVELSIRTLQAISLYAVLRRASPPAESQVVLTDSRGTEVAAIPVGQLPRVPRFLEVPDPERPGRHLEIGPIDVARLKALPAMRPGGPGRTSGPADRMAGRPDGRRFVIPF